MALHYSCFKIQKSKLNNLEESTRAFKAHYLLDDENSKGIELSNSLEEARALQKSIIDNAISAYKERTRQKPQFKKDDILWSAVVLIKPTTTMQDLQRLTEHFKQKYGWQNYHIAIHKDEGHINKETNEVKYNYHAHLEFVMLDEKGITSFKKGKFGKKAMSDIQTEVAELLGMIRGQNKRESKREGLNHKQYRQEIRTKESIRLAYKKILKEDYIHKDDIKKTHITKAEVAQIIENERKAWIADGGHTKDDYAELRALKQKSYEDKESLEKEIQELKEKIVKFETETGQKSILDIEAIENIKNENERLKIENNEIKQENIELRAFRDAIVRGISTLRAKSYETWKRVSEYCGGLRIYNNKIENPEVLRKNSNTGKSRGFR